MQLGWIDFSKEDRQKALDVINLLSEQGAVDELGIGIIRDAFANYFFPGTSTIQTRAKYFLIVPYVLREAVDGRYGKDVNRVLRAIDSAEKDCGIRLLEADPKAEGVIGTRVLPNGWVARKPSDIYWNGIRTFGIFCDYGLSIPEYVSLAVKLKEQKSVSRLGNRNDDAEENDKDDSDAGDIGNIRFWNLPIYHDDWRDNLTIELTQEEAFYLDKQIQKSTKGSLLEYVLKNHIDLNEYDDFASLTAELSEKVSEKLAYMMKLACDFNNLVYMARAKMMRTIKVTGKGKIAVKPDKIRLYVNKEELCKEYEDTLRRSTEDTELLKDLFEKLGFQRKDLKTVYFNVDTEYESYQDRDKSWKRRFKGYKYNHHMKIEFAADNKRLGQVLYALAHSSLRPEFSIEYTVADVEKCKNELLHKAIEDSIQKAQVLTTAANVKLGEIQAIDYSWGEIDFVTKPLNEMRLMECTECEMSAPGAYDIDIEADDINVTDTATVIWEIA